MSAPDASLACWPLASRCTSSDCGRCAPALESSSQTLRTLASVLAGSWVLVIVVVVPAVAVVSA